MTFSFSNQIIKKCCSPSPQKCPCFVTIADSENASSGPKYYPIFGTRLSIKDLHPNPCKSLSLKQDFLAPKQCLKHSKKASDEIFALLKIKDSNSLTDCLTLPLNLKNLSFYFLIRFTLIFIPKKKFSSFFFSYKKNTK